MAAAAHAVRLPMTAAALAKRLCAGGYPAAFLSADLPQAERSALMRKMHSFQLRVLVATDLLARGGDFGRVSLGVQMQTPRDVATYLHRVGRTGRFGKKGFALNLVHDDREMQTLKRIETYFQRENFIQEVPPDSDADDFAKLLHIEV